MIRFKQFMFENNFSSKYFIGGYIPDDILTIINNRNTI